MAALFTINQDMEAIQMATHRWMEKEDMVYVICNIIEYYSAIKKNEIMPLAATWMGLEMIK